MTATGFGATGFGGVSADSQLQPEAVVPLTSLYPVARVDLMPPEIVGQRRFRRAQIVMASALAGSIVVAGVSYLVSWQGARLAATDLAQEQSVTSGLQAEASTYHEVPEVLTSIDRARTALEVAMAADVPWYPYLYQLSLSTPDSLWFEKITFTSTTPESAASDPLATPGAVATVSTTGRALDYGDVVAWVTQMDSINTWQHALLSDAADDPDSGVITFTSTARLSADAYSNRFVPGAQDPAAGDTETGTGD